jgi:anti-sigma regulatory factor (Ser/Thr protein kinase)
MRAIAVDDRHLALLQGMDFASRVAVPLLWRGRSYGALDLFNGEGRSPFELEDVRFAEVLSERIAAALEDVRVYEREKKVSDTFQAAALAPSMPVADGVALDAVYVPAEREAEVGGDWYDAFLLDDGRIVVSVGDVAGKGLAGAVLMANVRQAIRVVALQNFAPGAILAAASKALAHERPDRIATAFVGIIDPVKRTCEYASAGHPAPVLRHPDGSVQFLPIVPALPLGLLAQAPPAALLAGIADGSMLVIYTDGVTEATRDIDAGERRLLASVACDATVKTARPARLICESVVAGDPKDDVAILTATFGGAPLWSFDALDAWAAKGTRSAFVRALREFGSPDSDFASAELIFGELVSNVVRHAPGRIELRLDWAGEAPLLHVIDTGAPFTSQGALPDDPFSEGGRGLFLIAALGTSLHVEALAGGGNHVRVGLPIRRAAVCA